MIIYPLCVAYFGFNAWCLYMAWYHTAEFQVMVDRFDNFMQPNRIASNFFVAIGMSLTIWGFVYSWYQH